MKQHITKEQWDELEKKQKLKFLKKFFIGRNLKEVTKEFEENVLISIGYLIEFLGDDFVSITRYKAFKVTFGFKIKVGKGFKEFMDREPIDAGWEAVKEKLS